jgi:electron transfer flavoprotein alpha subunit
MQRDVLVVTEHWGSEVETITCQMLAKGRELADGLGGQLLALVMGYEPGRVTETLRDKGMDKILVVDDPALRQAGAELQAHVVSEIARRTESRLVLIGYSLVGMELAPAVAARLGVPAVTNCISVELRDGALVVTRPLFDGTMHAQIVLEENGPAVVAIQKGITPSTQASGKVAPVEPFEVDLQGISFRSRVLEIIEEPATEVDISKADIIVSVGRGIGDKEKISIIQELADALGGVVACSRPVVDVGWLPRDRQVGASGKSVAPKVYIACGISGASQHLSGMSESGRIIAINKDANAPIFQVAHYGIVADLFDVVPALTQEAKKKEG